MFSGMSECAATNLDNSDSSDGTYIAKINFRALTPKNENSRTYPCPYCGNPYSMHSARLRHIRQMHKGMEEPEDREDDTNVVTCRICDAQFKRDQIGKHLTKTHKVTKGI